MTDARDGSLLAWQWSLYPAGHRDRRNLLVHALTVPVFQLGTVAVLVAPRPERLARPGRAWWRWPGRWRSQGRTHRLERNAARAVPRHRVTSSPASWPSSG